MPQFVEEPDLLMIQEQELYTTIKVFQLIDDGLTLSGRPFCSFNNYFFVDHSQAIDKAECHQLKLVIVY